jgi:DHA1 family bicyclomycin/chloramphenicol resistance-like MFS transporter
MFRPATLLPPVWLLAALPAVSVFASSVYLPSLPAMAGEFAVPVGQIQFTITAYLAGMAACMLLIGPLSDRRGRRGISLAMLALFLGGSVGTMLARDVGTLLVARVLQGAGASGGLVLARSMLRDAYDDVAVAKAGASIGTSIAVVPMLAPLVGGWVQQHLGWRANMGLVALLVLGLLAASLRCLPETLPPERRRRGAKRTMLTGYGELLAMRRFMAYALPVGCGAAAIFVYQTEAPVLLIGMLKIPASHYGYYGALPAIGFLAGSLVTRRLIGQVERGRLMELGLVLCILAGLVMAALALALPPTPLRIAAPMVLFGLGNGLLLPNGSYGSLSAAPLTIGAASALASCLRMGAGSLGSLLATALPTGSVLALGLVVSAVSAAGLIAWRKLGQGLALGPAREPVGTSPPPPG